MIELVAGGPLEEESSEALAVPVLAGREWGPGAPWAVERLGDWLPGHLDLQDFSGQVGQVVAVPTDRVPFRTLLLVGVGSQAGPEELRRAAGWLGRRTHQFVEVATTLHMLEVEGSARAVAEGFLLGQYRFDKYRSQPKPSKTRRLHLLGDPPEEMMKEAQQGRIIAEAVALARDLINEPAAAKPPEVLAGRAEEIGRRLGLRVKVYDEEAIEAEGFGGLRGVAAGAENPPRLVELWYEPDEPQAFLALVGKGIVFDSGGLSIKSASAMEPMKTDMSGAAVVYGAVQAIAGLGLPVKVLGITPLTENMPGGGAQRPGDVLRARNGKTIEVLNTDAEGRLVLADGLALAAEAEPDLIVDVATLTGSCRTALGDKIAGLWSNDQEAAEQVKAAADRAGERVWPMPLPEDYRKNLDSEVADMKNTGGRYGGAINASLLLQEFVNGRPWVHLDIAGPARWGDNEHYQSKGGSGFGVRTLVSLAEGMGGGGRRESSPPPD